MPRRVREVAQAEVAADAVVQVGHQLFDLIPVEPAQLDQLGRRRRAYRRRRGRCARQVDDVPAGHRMVAAADLVLDPYLQAGLLDALARCRLRG